MLTEPSDLERNLRDFRSAAKAFIKTGGQISINGNTYDDAMKAWAAARIAPCIGPEQAAQLAEDLRSLTVIAETLAQGNQYVPEGQAGKSPKLIITCQKTKPIMRAGVRWI